MARDDDEGRRGREADAISDFRSFLASYRQAVFFQARGMDEHAASHVAAAREEGRYLLARLLGRDVAEAEAARLIWFPESMSGPTP